MGDTTRGATGSLVEVGDTVEGTTGSAVEIDDTAEEATGSIATLTLGHAAESVYGFATIMISPPWLSTQ